MISNVSRYLIILKHCADRILYAADNLPAYNPCDTGFHDCDYNAHCEAQGGTDYTCTCNAGYRGDGYTCEDLNECANSPCPYNGICENSAGSYRCYCDSGYTMNNAGDECVKGKIAFDWD